MEDSKETIVDNAPVEESPSSSKDMSKTLPEEAFNIFLQGKRHILVQDYESAVQSLSTACEMYTNHFGEMAIECAELHFLYGKALFRLSQKQSGIIGGALNTGVEDDDDDEEDGKSSDDDSKENEESEKNDSEVENVEKPEADVEASEEKEPSESTDSPQPAVAPDEPAKETTETESSKAAADTSLQTEGNVTTEPEAEEDDLELAWNSLETSKSIYLRQGKDNVAAQLKVADILQLLAEISMESDNNIAAINDLKECLVLKKLHLKPDDRVLAETYYQMGLAQMLEKMYLDALENFETTLEILQLRIKNLKNTPVTDTPGSFERADCEKEIEELEGIVADIKEKIEDTKELIEDAKKGVEERIAAKVLEVEKTGFSDAETSEKKPVSNITHLLKRKKPDQEEDDRETKRSKLSPTVRNGDATVAE